LQLTERGRTHYQRAQTRIVQRLLPLMAALSPEDLRAVTQALPALGRVLSQADDASAPPPEGPPA
jgi:hypothetical protein